MGGTQSKDMDRILATHGNVNALKNLKAEFGFDESVEVVHEVLSLFQEQAPHMFQEALTCSSAISDARLPDCPLIWVNDFFERLTLYPKEVITGRNCRFLQGELTDRQTVAKVSKAVKAGEQLDVDILNYRRDGVPFWNRFSLHPIFDKDGLRYFFAIQKSFQKVSFTAIPYRKWTTIEVVLFLQQIGMNTYCPQFVEEEITGSDLVELSDVDLSILGVLHKRERVHFREQIKLLTSNQAKHYEDKVEDESKNRAIKIFFDKKPLLLVVNLETVDLVDITAQVLKFFDQDVLQLYVSKEHRPNILEYVVQRYYPEGEGDNQSSAPTSGAPQGGSKKEGRTEKFRVRAGKKKGKKKKASAGAPHLKQTTVKLDVPEMIDPTQKLGERAPSHSLMEGLVEIGTTKNLVEILEPLKETTLIVEAKRSPDRDLNLMVFLQWMSGVTLPLVLLSKHHAILKINQEAMSLFGVKEEWAVQGMSIQSLIPGIYESQASISEDRRMVMKIGRDGEGSDAAQVYDLKLSIVCEDCVCICFTKPDDGEDLDTLGDSDSEGSQNYEYTPFNAPQASASTSSIPIPQTIPNLPQKDFPSPAPLALSEAGSVTNLSENGSEPKSGRRKDDPDSDKSEKSEKSSKNKKKKAERKRRLTAQMEAGDTMSED